MSFADDNFGITERIELYHTVSLSLETAQMLTDFFIDYFKEQPVVVAMSCKSQNESTWGVFYVKERLIVLYKPCLGTLLHELAHLFSPEHGIKFKLAQHLIYSLFMSKLLYTKFQIHKIDDSI